MIFNNFKKIKVGYFYKYSSIVPRFLFQELSVSNVGCPATASNKNRIYGLKPTITMDIEFGLNDLGNPYYNYEFDNKNFHKTKNVHNAIEDMIVVQKQNNKCVLQVMQYIHLVTDNKKLEVTLLDPAKTNYKNCDFITASFKPYGWIRSINASYIQNSDLPGKVKLNVNEDVYRLFFNMPIDLNEIIPNEKIIRYEQTVFNVAGYLKGLNKIYPRILKLRPKKLL